MSTILHPCVESQFIENTKVLKLKVASPIPPPKSMEFARTTTSIENIDLKIKNLSSNTTEHGVGSGWSFLQAISSPSNSTSIPKEENNIYIQPLMYKYASSPRLSEKSLQLCTENLGCETGSFFMDTNILSLTSSYKNYYSMEEENPSKKQSRIQMASSIIKKVKYCSRELPPPLTTMRGEKSLQVKTHREDGRLIIQATEKPLKESCFLAQRSDGCLKLCFLKDVFTKKVDDDMMMQQQMSPQGNNEESENQENENEVKNKDDDDPTEENEEEEYKNKEIVMSKEHVVVVVNSNNVNDIEVENMGKEKAFQRLGVRWCKECGNSSTTSSSKKKMCNWGEPLWVATS